MATRSKQATREVDNWLTVHRTTGREKGAIDFLPPDWVKKDGFRENLQHDFLAADGNVYRARCSIRVTGRTAILNYAGKHERFNQQSWGDSGLLRILFRDAKRRTPVNAEWCEEEGEDYYAARVFFNGGERDIEVREGSPKLVAHLRRERSLKLREAKVAWPMFNEDAVRPQWEKRPRIVL
jgi:hypothetical protein